jgi:hypothetical protein
MLRAAELAQRQDAELHPSLAELIDRAKWREQIQRAKAGNVPLEFSLLFHRTARAIQCLNLWVSGGHAARRAA